MWHGVFQVYGVRPLLTVKPHGRAWNNRPLVESRFPFILVDAMVVKVRCTGINTEGYRGILGLMLGDTESEAS
ncbi:transposase [Paenibacillus pabuli]|uniref:transposase n=1 Tax=Paenibacillus pabuli TaxID=1472 RepID=UPI003D6C2225